MLDMERFRLTFDVSDRCRRALNILAGGTTLTVGQVIEQMIQETHPEALKLADSMIAQHEPVKSRRGRKPKSDK